MSFVRWLSEVSQDDVSLVGNNFYDLSLLYKARLPVANGFCITKQTFSDFLNKSGIKYKIENLLSQANVESKDALLMVAADMKSIIMDSDFPADLKRIITEAYSNMSVSSELHSIAGINTISLIKAGRESQFVALNTSFTDSSISMNGCIHNIKGADNLLVSIKKCWAESITADFLARLLRKEIKEEDGYPAIIVQKMVNASRSGLAYADSSIIIKAHWGLPGLANMEEVKPDVYVIESSQLNIKDIELNNQSHAYVRDENLGQTIKREIPLARRSIQILSESEIKRLAKVVGDISSIIGSEKQIEWAVEEGRLFITAVKRLRQQETYQDELFDEKAIINPLETVTDVSVYVEDAEEMENLHSTGIGLMESLLLQNKDEYFHYLRDDMEDRIVTGIADSLVKLATQGNHKEIWYKLIDKAEKFYDWRYELENEEKIDNLLGLELAAIKKARDLGFKSIEILIPQVNDAERIRNVKETISKANLLPGTDVKLGVLVDNPAASLMIDEICKEKVNLISIDINKLARYTLAVKKEEVNALHPAVIKQITSLAESAKKHNIKIGVCNFDASLDIIDFFIKTGIDNIASSIEDIDLVRNSVAKIEKKMLLSVARDSFKKSAF